jgi:hypothetical protein
VAVRWTLENSGQVRGDANSGGVLRLREPVRFARRLTSLRMTDLGLDLSIPSTDLDEGGSLESELKDLLVGFIRTWRRVGRVDPLNGGYRRLRG